MTRTLELKATPSVPPPLKFSSWLPFALRKKPRSCPQGFQAVCSTLSAPLRDEHRQVLFLLPARWALPPLPRELPTSSSSFSDHSHPHTLLLSEKTSLSPGLGQTPSGGVRPPGAHLVGALSMCSHHPVSGPGLPPDHLPPHPVCWQQAFSSYLQQRTVAFLNVSNSS